LSGPTLIAEGKTMLDQKMCPLSNLASLEKFRDLAVIYVFAYNTMNWDAAGLYIVIICKDDGGHQEVRANLAAYTGPLLLVYEE
jgi:hypothetical protein